MDNIDLNFLTECEVEIIVSVIEKDFELKASEKTRLCRLRKKLIRNDQRAVELSESTIDGFFCVICFKRFVFWINPKKVCCSCNLQVCKSCCKFIKIFENYVCQICQQQKDLIAMNCPWFYENIRRKFMDGGSQIVANSLSEYPRKNLISPAILNMVKGTQITKFRHQIEEVSRTIEESLMKVELSSTDREYKSAKYTELLQKFVEKLSQILRNISQVLFITMENYLNKIGKKNTNIDLEVLNTLHEEVELLIGRKIDIRVCQRNIRNRMSLEDLHDKDSLEACLSAPIVDKLLFDVQQCLMESRGLDYEKLNSPLKSMVKKTKWDSMDYEFESISQAPSRQGTLRCTFPVASPPHTLFENSRSASMESLHSSRLYSLTEGKEKSITVSKQWNELVANHSLDMLDSLSELHEPIRSPTLSFVPDDVMQVDSDALSMNAANGDAEPNWLMKARFPIGSLNSLFMESNDPCISRVDRKPSMSTKSEVVERQKTIDHEVNRMYQENRALLSNPNDLNIDTEYNRNLQLVTSTPNLSKNQQFVESGESQDSGIVACVDDNRGQRPTAPSRRSRILQSQPHLPDTPQIPKRKSLSASRPVVAVSKQDSNSDSSVEVNTNKKMIIVKSKRK